MMHILFPLLAVIIYFATPKGCDKTLNWILTGLFVLIWSFEEAIVKVNESAPVLFDGLWYDGILLCLFSVAAFLFYKSGGRKQFKLSLSGALLCALYAYLGSTGLYYEETFRADYYYVESMICLYFAQLFVAGGGMMLSRSSHIHFGGYHERRAAAGCHRNYSRRADDNNGDS